jgi:hypothetical protein
VLEREPERSPDESEESEGGTEKYGGDQDAGPAYDEQQADLDEKRDQAEG